MFASRSFRRAVFAFAAACLLTSQASAQLLARSKFYKVVSPGGTVPMSLYFGLNPNCTPTGEFTIRVVLAPRGGQILIDKHPGHPYFPPSNVRSVCNRRSLMGTRMLYQANSDFTGPDAFVVEVVYPSSMAVREAYKVRVE